MSSGVRKTRLAKRSVMRTLNLPDKPRAQQSERQDASGSVEAKAQRTTVLSCDSGLPRKKTATRILWAELLKKTFGIDVPYCSRCKTRTYLVGVLRDPQTILVTLTAMGLSARPTLVVRARRTGLWANAREFDHRIDATLGDLSDSDGTSTTNSIKTLETEPLSRS